MFTEISIFYWSLRDKIRLLCGRKSVHILNKIFLHLVAWQISVPTSVPTQNTGAPGTMPQMKGPILRSHLLNSSALHPARHSRSGLSYKTSQTAISFQKGRRGRRALDLTVHRGNCNDAIYFYGYPILIIQKSTRGCIAFIRKKYGAKQQALSFAFSHFKWELWFSFCLPSTRCPIRSLAGDAGWMLASLKIRSSWT